MALQALINSVAVALPLGFALGALLSAAGRLRRTAPALAERIEAYLPQTQCGECGYPGCQPYAVAVAQGAPINRCAPGGQSTVQALAELLDVAELPLDIEGEPKPKALAYIREAECIGCTKCIQACPVDAIVGAAKHMHTVIADECTGCDLCVAPCPVDCIEMRPLQSVPAPSVQLHQAQLAKTRFAAHQIRVQREAEQKAARLAWRLAQAKEKIGDPARKKDKQEIIREAIARAKAKKNAPPEASG
jgi:electron transport complex protein RnfB